MALTRRRVLLGLAGGATVIAVGGGALFATTRTPHAALAPWDDPGAGVSDPRIKALEWAVLVPNPHNRQPWLVELVGSDEAVLYCDLDRRLPMTDPFDRQITIGLGCFIEMFVEAAGADGFGVTVTPFPEGEPAERARLDERPVARLKLVEGAGQADPLFAAASYRRTNREAYEDRPIEPDHVAAMANAVTRTTFGAVHDRDGTAALTDLAAHGSTTEMQTHRTHQESVDLMRIGKAEINANPDGISLGGPLLEALALAGLISREALADPESQAYAEGVRRFDAMLATAAGWVWLTSAGNTRADQIATGRDWLRLHLAAKAAGLDLQPFSQGLQEYPEMAPVYADIHAHLGVAAPGRVQMLARIGYGPPVPPSPRWPAASRILTADRSGSSGDHAT